MRQKETRALHAPFNGEVEGPHRSAGPRRRGRTISQRPRRHPKSASRTPPTIVRRPHQETPVLLAVETKKMTMAQRADGIFR